MRRSQQPKSTLPPQAPSYPAGKGSSSPQHVAAASAAHKGATTYYCWFCIICIKIAIYLWKISVDFQNIFLFNIKKLWNCYFVCFHYILCTAAAAPASKHTAPAKGPVTPAKTQSHRRSRSDVDVNQMAALRQEVERGLCRVLIHHLSTTVM